MCRFAFYLGPSLTLDSLTTLPVHSIIKQSAHAKERQDPLNGDGFGVGWYVPRLSERPAVYRSASPAWSDHNLLDVARVTESPCILAHVRAASPGLAVTVTNCHPFTHGHFAFMHNGSIAGFSRVRRRLLASLSEEAFGMIQGSTDSEVLFGLFLDAYAATPVRNYPNGGPDVADRIARALETALQTLLAECDRAGIEEPCFLNVAVTDGERGVASRYASRAGQPASLYWHQGKRYVCEGGICRMLEADAAHGAVLVCSEPLSEDPGWDPVPEGHLVVVRRNRSVELRPLG